MSEPLADEPFYIRQSGEPMSVEESRAWFLRVAEEAHSEGATFARYAVHPDIPNLRIVEGWRERPDDQGEIRWSLTT